jgi:hypothetical protein
MELSRTLPLSSVGPRPSCTHRRRTRFRSQAHHSPLLRSSRSPAERNCVRQRQQRQPLQHPRRCTLHLRLLGRVATSGAAICLPQRRLRVGREWSMTDPAQELLMIGHEWLWTSAHQRQRHLVQQWRTVLRLRRPQCEWTRRPSRWGRFWLPTPQVRVAASAAVMAHEVVPLQAQAQALEEEEEGEEEQHRQRTRACRVELW